jgi:hypothetical protein
MMDLLAIALMLMACIDNHEDEEGYDNFIRQIKVENRDDQLIFEL